MLHVPFAKTSEGGAKLFLSHQPAKSYTFNAERLTLNAKREKLNALGVQR